MKELKILKNIAKYAEPLTIRNWMISLENLEKLLKEQAETSFEAAINNEMICNLKCEHCKDILMQQL